MKIFLFLFLVSFSYFGHASSINKKEFQNVYQSLFSMSGNKVMRAEIFNRDYGLLFEVATEINNFYATDVSEANTTFKDHMYYLAYLFFLKENEMKEDLAVENLALLLRNMYGSILKIIRNYNWDVQYGDVVYKGDDILKLPQFTTLHKEVKYKGSSLIKIFSAPLAKIIPRLLKESVLSAKTKSSLNSIQIEVASIQSSKNSSDLSRKINRAVKNLIDHFDDVEEELKIVSRALKRTGNLKALELVNKTRIVVNSLKELKDYGRYYSY